MTTKPKVKKCAVCRGHRWELWMVKRGGKSEPEARACPECNADGLLPIGLTVVAEVKAKEKDERKEPK